MESNRASQIGMNELEIQRKEGKKSSRMVWGKKIRQATKINPRWGGGELRRKGRTKKS